MLKYSCIDGALGAFALPAPERVAACAAVVATCGASGLLREGAYAAAGITFTHVLMDEAGQARLRGGRSRLHHKGIMSHKAGVCCLWLRDQ